MSDQSRKDRLNEMMQAMDLKTRYRWCDGTICGCDGSASCSGGLVKAGFTRAEWLEWVLENPNPNPGELY